MFKKIAEKLMAGTKVKPEDKVLEVNLTCDTSLDEFQNEALLSLKRTGILVLKNAIGTDFQNQLSTSAIQYQTMLLDRIKNNLGFLDLPTKYNFYEKTFAADLIAIDPYTKSEQNNLQLNKTIFYQALLKSGTVSFLRQLVSYRSSWSMARVRVIFPHNEGNSGALVFHQEKTVTPFAGLHNIWFPLSKPGLTTNQDISGIQFFVGDRQKLQNRRSCPNVEKQTQELMRNLSSIQNQKDPRSNEGYIYRPKLEAGDIIIFDGDVPHATYTPKNANEPRISCEIRIFPTPHDMGPKEIDLLDD